MENNNLSDPLVKPEGKALENALGKNNKLFNEFSDKIAEKNLVLEWHYYNDSKSWLCKVLNKKKNYAWISVWNTGFKWTFFFSEKVIDGVYTLGISSDTIKAIKATKPVGKSQPVILLMKNKAIMNEGLKILEYKMALK